MDAGPQMENAGEETRPAAPAAAAASVVGVVGDCGFAASCGVFPRLCVVLYKLLLLWWCAVSIGGPKRRVPEPESGRSKGGRSLRSRRRSGGVSGGLSPEMEGTGDINGSYVSPPGGMYSSVILLMRLLMPPE